MARGQRGTRQGIRENVYKPRKGGGAFMENSASTAVSMIEMMERRKLREMCINRFKWSGLPDTIDQRFIEKVLYEDALIVYVRPDEYKAVVEDAGDMSGSDMMLRATQTYYTDYQDNPLGFLVVGNAVYPGGTFSADECVPVWANTARMPDIDIVNWYARRLAEAERTIDINLKNARHTRLISIPDTQKMTATNMQRKMDEGEAVILVNETMDAGAYQVMDFGMDHSVLQAVAVAKNQIMNDCLTMLGINNANQDKKERLIGGEVDARSEQVGVNRAIALEERQRGAERINKMFNTNLSVEWNDEINKEIEQEDITNGDVHDGSSGSNENVSRDGS